MTSIELLEKAQSLLSECNDIVDMLDGWKSCNPTLNIDGLQKMTSTLLAEQKFLEKVATTPAEDIKAVQITSSNVPYLKSLVAALVKSCNPVAVRKTFSYSLDPFTVIEPSEKFKALPASRLKGGPAITKLTSSDDNSTPLSSRLNNLQSFHVKVDLVADHGKSWLRINAGSAWSLVHEFAGMEDDDSDEEEEEDSEDQDDDQTHKDQPHKPVHVSKDTHPDLALLVRSLVLAADQNRLHYFHRPLVTIHFAGIQEGENTQLEEMIHKSVRLGKVASSIKDGSFHQFPVECVLGPIDTPSDLSLSDSTPPTDATFNPFHIPLDVDDMAYFTPTIHLDITTLMALCSFLCHTVRPNPDLFTSPPLMLQAQQEHKTPLLPLLAKIFHGRERLVMSRAAATRFKSILSVIGGPEEQWRGSVMIHDEEESTGDKDKDMDAIRERWLKGSDWAHQYGVFATGPPRIDVIEDLDTREAPQGDESKGEMSRREQNMTDLHTKIFMTGHNARLTTLTANLVGYRTVIRMHQLPEDISIWFHAPRSLAEAKLPEGYSGLE
ncbi:hypothetical protein CPC16_007047 [Podila verticillata]|nr:hypothetical protein CPC16_007047 [Podila verticillata]KAI9240025.1 MAG: hypothetical protein BYD32DRAFT_392249 [Podila humilis]